MLDNAGKSVRRSGLVLVCVWSLAALLRAEEPAAVPPPTTAPPATVAKDPDLPQPFDTNTLVPMITNNPFNRAVNVSDSLVLTGMATVDGKHMVTLMDKAAKKTYVVSEEPNENGWKLAETPAQVNLKRAQVKISMGAEIVTIRHDREGQEESMKKDKTSPGSTPSSQGPSADDKGYKRSPRTGPPPEVRERWEKLSDEAKEKLKSVFRDNRERMGAMTEEQRRSFLESNFKNIAESDEAARRGK